MTKAQAVKALEKAGWRHRDDRFERGDWVHRDGSHAILVWERNGCVRVEFTVVMRAKKKVDFEKIIKAFVTNEIRVETPEVAV